MTMAWQNALRRLLLGHSNSGTFVATALPIPWRWFLANPPPAATPLPLPRANNGTRTKSCRNSTQCCWGAAPTIIPQNEPCDALFIVVGDVYHGGMGFAESFP